MSSTTPRTKQGRASTPRRLAPDHSCPVEQSAQDQRPAAEKSQGPDQVTTPRRRPLGDDQLAELPLPRRLDHNRWDFLNRHRLDSSPYSNKEGDTSGIRPPRA